MTGALMTRGEYAAHRSVTPANVSIWKRKGLIAYAEDPADGKLKIDVVRSDAKVNAAIDPTRGRPSRAAAQKAEESPPAPMTPPAPPQSDAAQQVADVRVDFIREQTIGKRMKNAADAGALVPLEEYAGRIEKFGRLSLERMTALVRSLAERLAAERDPRQLVALLETEIARAFERLKQDALTGAEGEAVEESADDVESEEQQEAVLAEPAEETEAAA
jgi:hypothetical protein